MSNKELKFTDTFKTKDILADFKHLMNEKLLEVFNRDKATTTYYETCKRGSREIYIVNHFVIQAHPDELEEKCKELIEKLNNLANLGYLHNTLKGGELNLVEMINHRIIISYCSVYPEFQEKVNGNNIKSLENSNSALKYVEI